MPSRAIFYFAMHAKNAERVQDIKDPSVPRLPNCRNVNFTTPLEASSSLQVAAEYWPGSCLLPVLGG